MSTKNPYKQIYDSLSNICQMPNTYDEASYNIFCNITRIYQELKPIDMVKHIGELIRIYEYFLTDLIYKYIYIKRKLTSIQAPDEQELQIAHSFEQFYIDSKRPCGLIPPNAPLDLEYFYIMILRWIYGYHLEKFKLIKENSKEEENFINQFRQTQSFGDDEFIYWNTSYEEHIYSLYKRVFRHIRHALHQTQNLNIGEIHKLLYTPDEINLAKKFMSDYPSNENSKYFFIIQLRRLITKIQPNNIKKIMMMSNQSATFIDKENEMKELLNTWKIYVSSNQYSIEEKNQKTTELYKNMADKLLTYIFTLYKESNNLFDSLIKLKDQIVINNRNKAIVQLLQQAQLEKCLRIIYFYNPRLNDFKNAIKNIQQAYDQGNEYVQKEIERLQKLGFI